MRDFRRGKDGGRLRNRPARPPKGGGKGAFNWALLLKRFLKVWKWFMKESNRTKIVHRILIVIEFIFLLILIMQVVRLEMLAAVA
jgi:hypothetical protein